MRVPMAGERTMRSKRVVSFLDACLRHDFGYRNYGRGMSMSPNEDPRHWIDNILFLDWLDACAGATDCRRYASDLHAGLRLCGQDAFTGNGPVLCPTWLIP